jgi:hypothetical protein
MESFGFNLLRRCKTEQPNAIFFRCRATHEIISWLCEQNGTQKYKTAVKFFFLAFGFGYVRERIADKAAAPLLCRARNYFRCKSQQAPGAPRANRTRDLSLTQREIELLFSWGNLQTHV